MSLDDKVRDKALGSFLGRILGQAFEHIAEMGLFAFIFKMTFGLTIKNAIAIAIIVVMLSIFKKIYYRDDLFLAFAILLLFQENILLSWLLFVYVSYFRGLYGIVDSEFRASHKFSVLRNDVVAFFGQYIFPVFIIIAGKRFREARDGIVFLVLLAFWHHLNYYAALLIDMAVCRKGYTKAERWDNLIRALKDTRLNMLVTIAFIWAFKAVVFKYVYTEASWGVIDKIFELLSWII